MTTYILIVYLTAGGKMAYPFQFDTMDKCQAVAEEFMGRPDAVLGTVCVEQKPIRQVRQ